MDKAAAAGKAVQLTDHAVKKSPAWVAVGLVLGALIFSGGFYWAVKEARAGVNQEVRDDIEDRPTRLEMTRTISSAIREAFDLHAAHPHPGAVSRQEFSQVLKRLDRLEGTLDSVRTEQREQNEAVRKELLEVLKRLPPR